MNSLRVARWPYRVTDPAPTYTTPRDVNCSRLSVVGGLVGRVRSGVVKVGVEGTGSYGVGLTRHLHNEGVVVVEVDRPNRQTRRRLGKSDPIDAEAAARAALSGSASVTPKRRDGTVEQMRVLMIARRSARMQRNQTLNQLRQVVICGPDEIRARFKDRYKTGLVSEAARMRPRKGSDPITFTTNMVIRSAGPAASRISTTRWQASIEPSKN